MQHQHLSKTELSILGQAPFIFHVSVELPTVSGPYILVNVSAASLLICYSYLQASLLASLLLCCNILQTS